MKVTLRSGPYDGKEVEIPEGCRIFELLWFNEDKAERHRQHPIPLVTVWDRVKYERRPGGRWQHTP